MLVESKVATPLRQAETPEQLRGSGKVLMRAWAPPTSRRRCGNLNQSLDVAQAHLLG